MRNQILVVFAMILILPSLVSAFNFEGEGVKIISPLESNGAIPINIQDQTSPPFDFFFTQLVSIPTTLAEPTFVDNITINVTSAVGISTGDYLGIFNSDDPLNNRAYFGQVLSITGTILTLDTPLDFDFLAGDTVGAFTRNLNVAGTPSNPEIYSVRVGPQATQSIDVTRIMVSFITDTAVDLSKLGDIAGGVDNGIVLRRVDGDVRNIFNIKNNGELANLCFDYAPYTSTNPAQGQDGAKFRYTFAGQDKHGVAVRLNPGDELQVIIQDDLTDLQQFRVIAEGHYVTD